jgi:xanthine phosphoribosyltransferase
MLNTIPISWPEIERDAKCLADLVSSKGQWEGVVAVARGGLVPAALVANLLGIKNIELLSVSSYTGRKQHEPRLLRCPTVPNGGAKWLVIDDLVDTGVAMKLARNLLPKSHVAVLYAKPAGRLFADSFAREFLQTDWLSFPWEKEVQPINTPLQSGDTITN